jgi:hypothetical protein
MKPLHTILLLAAAVLGEPTVQAKNKDGISKPVEEQNLQCDSYDNTSLIAAIQNCSAGTDCKVSTKCSAGIGLSKDGFSFEFGVEFGSECSVTSIVKIKACLCRYWGRNWDPRSQSCGNSIAGWIIEPQCQGVPPSSPAWCSASCWNVSVNDSNEKATCDQVCNREYGPNGPCATPKRDRGSMDGNIKTCIDKCKRANPGK